MIGGVHAGVTVGGRGEAARGAVVGRGQATVHARAPPPIVHVEEVSGQVGDIQDTALASYQGRPRSVQGKRQVG